ncbi:phosphoglycerate kinase [Alphaproteobacteria bacterium]|nr:phosphoglycerate kinase [Alphaproteobacteria bacterium]GHS95713.1 phosphoglycerate kinase [Alphaproteobacteria bacterium]
MIQTLRSFPVAHKTVLVRVDFNVPGQGGHIEDATRIVAARPTLDFLRQEGARVILMSHFKDPKKENLADPKVRKSFSFEPFLPEIAHSLERKVFLFDLFEDNLSEKIKSVPQSDLILLDNSRFWPGEKTCDDALARRLAAFGDVFVNEAFSCAHRDHASVTGVARHLPTLPGFHFQTEIQALKKALDAPQRPVVAIVGGAKVSSKFPILENLLPKVDFLLLGGAMVHTFFAAQRLAIGQSLYEPEFVKEAQALMQKYTTKIVLPVDVRAAKSLDNAASESIFALDSAQGFPPDVAAFDIGPQTVKVFAPFLKKAHTVIWNGTLGVAEHPSFDQGSKAVAALICQNPDVFSLAGGGDTLSALKQLGFAEKFSHVCTGGGAFLEFLAQGSLLAEKTFLS